MTRRRVVTEREVHRAERAGEKSLDVSGALVTPSARDAAVRAQIELSGLAELAPRARTPRRSAPDQIDPAEAARRESRRAERESPRRGAKGPEPRSPGAPAADRGRERPRTSGADRTAAEPKSRPDTGGGTGAGRKSLKAESSGGRSAAERPAPADAAPPRTAGSADKKPGATASGDQALAVALGADHGGVSLKGAIADRLRELGLKVLDFGTVTRDPVDYPDFAVAVAQAVATGRATVGVMIDGAGIGSCMAANKVSGVRAAMCYDVTTAINAREHNNANVLTLGAGLIGTRLAITILETFLSTPFAGGRHAARVSKIDALDRPG